MSSNLNLVKNSNKNMQQVSTGNNHHYHDHLKDLDRIASVQDRMDHLRRDFNISIPFKFPN